MKVNYRRFSTSLFYTHVLQNHTTTEVSPYVHTYTWWILGLQEKTKGADPKSHRGPAPSHAISLWVAHGLATVSSALTQAAVGTRSLSFPGPGSALLSQPHKSQKQTNNPVRLFEGILLFGTLEK